MKKVVLTFGSIAGAISALLMGITTVFADRIGFDKGEYIGYTTIVLASLLIFFGVKAYRDNELGGTITFGRALGVGLGIALISAVCYVVAWEVMYYLFMPDFMDKYGAYLLAKLKARNASQGEITTQMEAVARMKVMYANPLWNAAMTILEPLPINLLVTLASAAILRKKPVEVTV